MKKTFLALALVNCSLTAIGANGIYSQQGKHAVKVLTDQKYHDIQILYTQGLRCEGVFDQNRTGFRAISPDNHIVTGFVCNDKVYLKTQSETENPMCSEA